MLLNTPPLYHHTDSARLPWILRDQSLKPGNNNIGDFPDDFLWATPDPMGDPTASSPVAKYKYRDGDIAAVRFTLSATDFAPCVSRALAGAPHLNPGKRRHEDGGLAPADRPMAMPVGAAARLPMAGSGVSHMAQPAMASGAAERPAPCR